VALINLLSQVYALQSVGSLIWADGILHLTSEARCSVLLAQPVYKITDTPSSHPEELCMHTHIDSSIILVDASYKQGSAEKWKGP